MKIANFLKKSLIVPTLFTASRFETELHERLSAHGVTILEALILVGIVFENRDCRPSELSLIFHTSRPRISQALKKLVAKNLIERKMETKDARFIVVKITSKGRSLSTKLVSVFDQMNDRIEKIIGVKNAELAAGQLFLLLGKL